MIGTEVMNVALDANEETTIQYDTDQQKADMMNLGPGTVYVSWRKTADVGDAECLKLPSGSSYELRPKKPWRSLSIVADTDATGFQVVVG